MSAVISPDLQKPIPLKVNLHGIHPELKALDQWVMWRYAPREGKAGSHTKWTKVPYQPNGRPASSTDPETWSSFNACADIYEQQGTFRQFDGIGFVTRASDDYNLIDLDHVMLEGEPMAAWAKDLVETAISESAYVETSVGGDGVHVIVRGPQGFKGTKANDVEIYCADRFFTITGQSSVLLESIGRGEATVTKAFERAGCTLEQRAVPERVAENLCEQGIPMREAGASKAATSEPEKPERITTPLFSRVGSDLAPVDDGEIVQRARQATNGAKFTQLYDQGSLDGYANDASRADLALASLVAFWTGPDPLRIERIMRSSALTREKWDDHKTYLALTINKALSRMGRQDFYDWSRHGKPGMATNPAVQAILAEIVGTPSPGDVQSGAQTAALIIDRRGVVTPCVHNAIHILKSDPDLRALVAYDEFADRLVITGPMPGKEGSRDMRRYPRRWEDADTVLLLAYIQREMIPSLSKTDVQDALLAHQQDCKYHPVRDYLNTLLWDGVPRLDTWLIEYTNGDSSAGAAYLEEIGSKFLISAVARVFQPGCKADHVLVLEGEQGSGKSSALAALAGDDWFSDSLPADLSHKDTAAHLKGKWIIEMSELSQFQRSNVETVKSYITRQSDKYRPAYGRQEVEIPRQCVFTGSTNSDSYLVDTTGNRRFWPVKVQSIDVAALRLDRDLLWAEAVTRYKAGEAWHITDADVAAAQAQEVAKRTVADPWEADVVFILDNHRGDQGLTPGEVLDQMQGLNPSDKHKGNAARVSQIMRDNGWRKERRDGKRGQIYQRGAPA